MIKEIIRRIGAPQYVTTHGFLSALATNVVAEGAPIQIDFTIEFLVHITIPVTVATPPIALNFDLRGTGIVEQADVVVSNSYIILNFELFGEALVPPIVFLDMQANLSLDAEFKANINTEYAIKTPVELEEEVAHARIT